MPPRRKSKVLAEVSTTPKASSSAHDDDAMDVDTPKDNTPKASGTPRTTETTATTTTTTTTIKPHQPSEAEILGNLWTEDQISSLFKAIIRWKPSGMHKHFRLIAISEHLRNHGFDPDVETHTRIPGIRAKLREFYDMDMIDERDNAFDYVRLAVDGEPPEAVYKDFELPPDDFHDLMWARAAADDEEPDDWYSGSDEVEEDDEEDSDSSRSRDTGRGKKVLTRKRKRGGETSSVAGSVTAKTLRASTVEDTDRETTVVSSPVTRSGAARGGARGGKRVAAAAKAKTESPDTDEDEDESSEDEEEEESSEEEDEEEDDENEDDDDDDDEPEQEEETVEAPPARSTRGGSSARGRGKGRGRGKAGRKKG